MFPRKEAWSTLWKSARFDPPTGVDAFRCACRARRLPLRSCSAGRTRSDTRARSPHTARSMAMAASVTRSWRVRCTLRLHNLHRCRSLRQRSVKWSC